MNFVNIKVFIEENREVIDYYIKSICNNLSDFNDNEREEWVRNTEELFYWARANRVNL